MRKTEEQHLVKALKAFIEKHEEQESEQSPAHIVPQAAESNAGVSSQQPNDETADLDDSDFESGMTVL